MKRRVISMLNNLNLNSVLQEAQEVTSRSENSNDDRMKLIYPQPGQIEVRLLYNIPSGILMRLIRRHNIEGTKHICLSNYGQDCPICNAINNIQNATGSDLWKLKSSTRGIAIAEYVSDQGYKWDDNRKPEPGEIILLMFPWSVYQGINRVISLAGANINSLIASNTGGTIIITRKVENSRTKYDVDLNAYNMAHNTCSNEDEFEKMMNSLPNLNDMIIPSELDPKEITNANYIAGELTNKYLGNRIVQQYTQPQATTLAGTANNMYTPPVQVPPQQTQAFVQGSVPPQMNTTPPWENPVPAPVPPQAVAPQPTVPQPTAPQVQPTAQFAQEPIQLQQNISNIENNMQMPPCYGQSVSQDANKCAMCPVELNCKSGK